MLDRAVEYQSCGKCRGEPAADQCALQCALLVEILTATLHESAHNRPARKFDGRGCRDSFSQRSRLNCNSA